MIQSSWDLGISFGTQGFCLGFLLFCWVLDFVFLNRIHDSRMAQTIEEMKIKLQQRLTMEFRRGTLLNHRMALSNERGKKAR